MTAFLLLLHFGSTVALWREVRGALEMRWRTATAYAVGLAMWWVSAIMIGYSIGAWAERVAQ